MKKLLFLFAFLGIAVVVFHSCKKDKIQSPENDGQEISYTAEELSIWRNLSDFNSKIKSGLKSEEFISPDSALWYLEALYNVTQASNATFDKLVTDTTYYSFNADENGKISMSDVIIVYNQMITDKQNKLDSFEEDTKFLVLGDIFEDETTRDFTTTIGLISGYGFKVLPFYEEITSIDNWYYGNVLGRSDGQFMWESDAGFELERRFNNIKNIEYNIPHDSAHAVEIKTRTAFPVNYQDDMYYVKWPIGDTLIQYQDLQNYLIKGHNNIIYKYEIDGGKRPSNLDFLAVDVTTNDKGTYTSDSLYYHVYEIYYTTFINLPPIGD